MHWRAFEATLSLLARIRAHHVVQLGEMLLAAITR